MDPFYLALLLYCAAVVLAFVDIFVPSGGMLLILALSAAFASILFGFRSGNTMGMTMLTIVIASIPIFAVVAIKIWPHTPIGKRIILSLPQHDADMAGSSDRKLTQWIGTLVRADSPLMPSGQIRIGSQYLNAIAESGVVEEGQNVEVIGVKERNLIVRPTQAGVTTAPVAQPAEPDANEEMVDDRNLLERPAEEFGLESFDQ